MLISYNWLRQFVDLPDSLAPEDVALKLTMSTVEVEGVQRQGTGLNGIVVGKVVSVEKHPNADKLKVCKVDDGSNEVQVVCGGSNVREGMLVAFAKLGAKIKWHGDGELVEMKEAEIRGVKSFGMICASTEIGLGERFPLRDEKEILDVTHLTPAPLLGKERGVIGMPLAKVLGLDDVVFEIDNKSITNRPDLWGHYGIAREVAALYKKPLKEYKVKEIKKLNNKEIKLKINIEDKENCLRYMGAIVGGIKIAQSPKWMQDKLITCGVRPINNIVDITNYVTLELGRPSHAFDRRDMKNDTIIVRRAKQGEKFTTLDGQERTMTDQMCMVCDAERAVDLGGIMGGLNSEIKEDTTEIILELANFNPANIRRTANALSLRTEAAVRFEKGLPSYLAEEGMWRIINLIQELIPSARLLSKVVDMNYQKERARKIELPMEFLDKKIGIKIGKKTAVDILQRLGFLVKEKKDVLSVTVPLWRPVKDISIPEDLVEEVARIYGYDNIKTELPMFPITPPEKNHLRLLERKIKNLLSLEHGFTEVYNYSFVSPATLEKLEMPLESFVELDNPVAKDRPYLRHNLWTGLSETLEKNLHQFASVKIFEIGKVFIKDKSGMRAKANGDELLPYQPTYLGLAYAEKGVETPFYTISEAVTSVLNKLGCGVELKPAEHELGKFIHAGRQAQILVNGVCVGAVSELSPLYEERLGIDARAVFAELDLDLLLPLIKDNIQYHKISQYPSVVRDIAFVVDKKVAHKSIINALYTVNPLIREVELFDSFEGKNIGEGKKSLAYHITYRSDEKTLETKEVDVVHENVVQLLKSEFTAEIR